MGVSGRGHLRFGDFEFDLLSGKLFRGGRPVKIQPQPLRVLAVLLERAGETVSRESLRARVWGDATFVEFDQGLNYCIRQIRVALRDGASEPVYIETLPKQGYRFIAPIEISTEVPGSMAQTIQLRSRRFQTVSSCRQLTVGHNLRPSCQPDEFPCRTWRWRFSLSWP